MVAACGASSRALGPAHCTPFLLAVTVHPCVVLSCGLGYLQAAYGDRHPRFQEASWHTASQTAGSDHRFLFVYLHSPEHEVGAQMLELAESHRAGVTGLCLGMEGVVSKQHQGQVQAQYAA
jgi:hypothetical protein